MFEPKDKTFDKDALQTPPFLFNWLNSHYQFDVDLCASDDHHLTPDYYSLENSCLDRDWLYDGHNIGFCNPPYSNIDPFMEKAIEEADKGFITVFLIPDFNGEKRFDWVAEHATTVIHLIGRVSFIRPDNGKKYTGNNRGSAIIEFSKKYWNIPPAHQYFRTNSIETQWSI